MKVAYELNPPKIINGDNFDPLRLEQDIELLIQRASRLNGLVDGIHITDSVLGISRLSAVTSANYIRKSGNTAQLGCSLRVRDRNMISITQVVVDAILAGVGSILVLAGDEPVASPKNFGLKPSNVLIMLNEKKYDRRIRFNLSVPNIVKSTSSIQRKIEARPYGFVTQSITSLSGLGEIVDIAKPYGIGIVGCIMVPSQKNKSSADMIGLDWQEYERNPIDFILGAGKLADEILVTSPNSFASGIQLLEELKNN
jgi:5,10-methylenetetrahydrofolate reductase